MGLSSSAQVKDGDIEECRLFNARKVRARKMDECMLKQKTLNNIETEQTNTPF